MQSIPTSHTTVSNPGRRSSPSSLEKWLTSPVKMTSNDIANITVRKPPPREEMPNTKNTATGISPCVSLRRKLTKKQQQQQFAPTSDSTSNKISAHCHRGTVTTMEKDSRLSRLGIETEDRHHGGKNAAATFSGEENNIDTGDKAESDIFSFNDLIDCDDERFKTAANLLAVVYPGDNGNGEHSNHYDANESICNNSVHNNPITITSTEIAKPVTSKDDAPGDDLRRRLSTRTSPVVLAAIRKRRQQRLQRREHALLQQQTTTTTEMAASTNCRSETDLDGKPIAPPSASPMSSDGHSNTGNEGDSRLLSVSTTKKIHLLKRHDAGGGETPLPATGVAASSQRPSSRKQSRDTITSTCIATALNKNFTPSPSSSLHENNEDTTSDQSRLIRRHGSNESDGQDTNASTAIAGPAILTEKNRHTPCQRRQAGKKERYPHSHSYQNPNAYTNENNKCNNETSSNAAAIGNNTRLVKEAIARARCNRNNLDDCSSRYGKMVTKSHFRSGNISCSSASTTSTSTDSVASATSSRSSISQSAFQNSENGGRSNESKDEDEGSFSTKTAVPIDLTATDKMITGPPLSSPSPYEMDTGFVSQTETGPIRKHSPFTPPIIKHHPQHHSISIATIPCPSNEMDRTRKMNSTMSMPETREKDPSSVKKGIVIIQAKKENQESCTASAVGNASSQSEIAGLVKETADVGTAVSSASNKSKLQQRQQQQPQQPKINRIKLHVYDLVANDTQLELWGCQFPLGQVFNAVNSSLHSIGTGAYHVGVEVSTNTDQN